MRRVIPPLLLLCAFSKPAPAETVEELIVQLQALKPGLEAVVQIDRNLLRSVAAVRASAALPLALPEPGKATYYQLTSDGSNKHDVAIVGGGLAVAALEGPAPVTCESACSAESLTLVDVSCDPPHGDGPDGRAWVHLVCGNEKALTPYDWQLARLDARMADVFAWNDDPTYAYVQGQSGSYQASAYTGLGQISINVELQVSCGTPGGDAWLGPRR